MGFEINQDLARRNVDLILGTGAKTVITGCPYCSRTFNKKPPYGQLMSERVEVVHLSQFLRNLDLKAKTDQRVTYHDPCDLGRHRRGLSDAQTL